MQEGRAQVSSHVIGSLRVMDIARIAIGSDALEPVEKISLHVRISILLNHETGGSMLTENDADSCRNPGPSNDDLNVIRNLDQATTLRGELQRFLMLAHD